jgi:hypothetical protein
MKFISAIAAAASICAASPAFSSLIDFESITSQDPVTTRYQGPTGVVFSGAGVLQDSNFDPLGWTSVSGANGNAGGAVYAQGGTGDYFTMSGDFLGGTFSFRYSTKSDVTVNVFDGSNSSLSLYTLTANDDGSGSTWNLFTVGSLAAGAKSIQFGGDAGFALYDDITATAAVPLPAALMLFPFGAAALGAAARRRKAAAAV